MDRLDEVRAEIAKKYVSGVGIEIGASGRPVGVAEDVMVTYVDHVPSGVVARQYSIDESGVKEPDLIDDGMVLDKIIDGSLDFIIACHVLEHSQDFLTTVENHVRKIKDGGILYYILPDMSRMSDCARGDSTTFEHLLADRRDGGRGSLEDHLAEWRRIMPGQPKTADIGDHSEVHFHAWSSTAQERLWFDVRDLFRCLSVKKFVSLDEWPECVVVLRKAMEQQTPP
jgi:hypothetical protein